MLAQTPVQIAWVTRDLEATESALTSMLGAKKWVRMPGVHFAPEACTYRGEPADFVADISLSYAGDTQLELIAPVSGRNIYADFLDTAGPGMHHICIEVDDVEAALTERKAEAVQRGVMPGGMEFAYIAAAGVPYLEIAHIPDEIRAFFDYIKQEQQ
ncbi:flavoprotein [Mycolicibacterium flavescens]|uniref:VOC family protein n=1 Tax=Mycobacterium TaxID=1763 RepID=UPI0007FED7FC|nr:MULTISPECIES: VOC family protein [Mycobacterium]OBF93169.1 lactoylglutathione lyase [Mycobacterium sp. 852002-51152_SCH6134967]VEG41716.1 flavoprotein [Mycolicibacterium flavescens]